MSPADLRVAIDSANVDIQRALHANDTAAILAQDLTHAQVLVSRKVGWQIVLGTLQVKLKKHRL